MTYEVSANVETTPNAVAHADLVATHLARLGAHYRQACTAEAVAAHARAAAELTADNLAVVTVDPRGEATWVVTIVAYDFLSELSVICGLFTAHGLNIRTGEAFTYSPGDDETKDRPEPQRRTGRRRLRRRHRTDQPVRLPDRKIVDWFTVTASEGEPDWASHGEDLRSALSLLARGDVRGARGLVATRVADYLRAHPATQQSTFIPVTVDIATA